MYDIRYRFDLACLHDDFHRTEIMQFFQEIGGRNLMDREIIDFFFGDLVERDVENFAWLSASLHGIDDHDNIRTDIAQGDRKQNFSYARACVYQANVVGDIIMVIEVFDDFRPESRGTPSRST